MRNAGNFLSDTRITGLLYLGLAVTGIITFIFAKNQIFITGYAIATSTNLIEKEALARMGVAAELALVIFQTLTALWFYKIFNKVDSFAALMILLLGTVNAIMILTSSAFWLAALNSSLNNDAPMNIYNLFNIHEQIWLVSGLFFGLWLLPMGYLAAKAKLPRLLSWILILGGVGYILSTFLNILTPNLKTLAESLPILATVGEFWIIGYLLINSKLKSSST